MPRVKFEFHCSGGCSKYFDFKLNTALNGNYRLHCPNCGHVHFRIVRNGKITEGRFTDSPGDMLIDDIYPMKSSCRDYQKETEKDLDTSKGESFIHRLWREKFSNT